MPQPDETLDFPPYQPPKPRKFPVLHLVLLAVTGFVLLMLVMSNAHPPRPRATKGLVARMRMACDVYSILFSAYPWTSPTEVTGSTRIVNREVYTQLQRAFAAERESVCTLEPQFLHDGTIVDQWGREIQFRVDPKTMKPVVWSCGRDGKDDTNDGESPDPAKLPKTYYWFGRGDTGDDIVSR